MAIVFYSNGLLYGNCNMAIPQKPIYFYGSKIIAIVSENSSQVDFLLNIIQNESLELQSLLEWVSNDSVFYIHTAAYVITLSRKEVVRHKPRTILGQQNTIVKLLKRLRLSDLSALWWSDLIHGKFNASYNLLTTTSTGLNVRKQVPPMLAARKHARSLLRNFRITKG